MKKIIIEGATGSGKTFEAFKIAKSLGGSYAYFSPTGLLAYDSYCLYSGDDDCLSAKGVEIQGKSNSFSTYKWLKDMGRFSTVIVDEAHWITGDFPGQSNFIKDVIQNFRGNIILVTATRTFKNIRGFYTHRINVKKQNRFNRKEISINESIKRAESGIKTLIICDRIKDTEYWENILYGTKIKIINRKYSELEILENIIAYENGDITTLCATNIAAQGVNLNCENLILDFFISGDHIGAKQKIGRLGRYGQKKETKLTFSVTNSSDNYFFEMPSHEKKIKKTSVNLDERDDDYDDYDDFKIDGEDLEDIIHLLNKKKAALEKRRLSEK